MGRADINERVPVWPVFGVPEYQRKWTYWLAGGDFDGWAGVKRGTYGEVWALSIHSITLEGGSGLTPSCLSMLRHWARWCMAWVVTCVTIMPRVKVMVLSLKVRTIV